MGHIFATALIDCRVPTSQLKQKQLCGIHRHQHKSTYYTDAKRTERDERTPIGYPKHVREVHTSRSGQRIDSICNVDHTPPDIGIYSIR
ncbi:hypothetical protein EVAR_81022_1 [Eumeta japonica]|uniref:Uncharacterized protein n=1 Tax=Eumeta variegata TaxID=151549 RepID=A0A4C1T6B1_EUMVA|nr:hypothetical protein EVAR_81022_1 [Eumeta japonica]